MSPEIHEPAPSCVEIGPNVVVCGGGGLWGRTTGKCPTCGRQRPMLVHYEAWYGYDHTCLGCGDSWADGEMAPRPFERGWREKAKARARECWTTALHPGDFKASVRAEIDSWVNR